MLALFQLGGVQLVIESNQKRCPLRNAVWRRRFIDISAIALREDRYSQEQNGETPNPARPETGHIFTPWLFRN
jgi:hypothetical protein